MEVNVKDAVAKLRKEFSHLADKEINTAVARALNHTARKGVTASGKEIRNVFNIGASQLNKSLSMEHAHRTRLYASIVAKGRPIPLQYFGAKQQLERGLTSFNRKGVASTRLKKANKKRSGWGAMTFQIYKGKQERLPGVFILGRRSRVMIMGKGVYSKGKGFQFAKERNPINAITGISVPLMFASKNVKEPFMKVVNRDIESRMRHELDYLISKMKW